MTITEKHFKKANSRFINYIKEITNNEVELKNLEGLQALSRILYEKSYEEIKETILESSKKTKNKQKVLGFLRCGGTDLITLDGNYYKGNFEGSDFYINYEVFENLAKDLANDNNALFVKVDIPINKEDYENEDLIQMAMEMGVYNPKESLFDAIYSNQYRKILINDLIADCGISDDWYSKVSDSEGTVSEALDETVWMPECTENNDLYEYYFSAKELMNTYKDKNGIYVITQNIGKVNEVTHIIELLN